MMFSLAWRWSSFTQAFALSREAYESFTGYVSFILVSMALSKDVQPV